MSSVLTTDMFSVVVPRPGVRPRRSGENLISPEELTGQETPGPADQQQSQAAGPVLLYPLAPYRHSHSHRTAVFFLFTTELRISSLIPAIVYLSLWVLFQKLQQTHVEMPLISVKCLDLLLPQMLSRHVCLCCGVTWSTTCCIVLPPTPRTPWCPEPVCTDLASQTVRKDVADKCK